eukprot:2000647-Rhodomonas_salina.2
MMHTGPRVRVRWSRRSVQVVTRFRASESANTQPEASTSVSHRSLRRTQRSERCRSDDQVVPSELRRLPLLRIPSLRLAWSRHHRRQGLFNSDSIKTQTACRRLGQHHRDSDTFEQGACGSAWSLRVRLEGPWHLGARPTSTRPPALPLGPPTHPTVRRDSHIPAPDTDAPSTRVQGCSACTSTRLLAARGRRRGVEQAAKRGSEKPTRATMEHE